MPAKRLFLTVKLGGNTDKFVPNGFTRVFCCSGRAAMRRAAATTKIIQV